MPRRATPRPPPCTCTTDGTRCPEARRLRDVFSRAFMANQASAATKAREAYAKHLRLAGVQAGQAQWEEATG